MLQKIQFNLMQGQGEYSLLPVEFLPEQIPFEVKRTYFLLIDNQETQTGQHAHFEEEEVFLVLRGEVDLVSIDKNGDEYLLNLKQGEAVYIPKMVWHGFKNIKAKSVICAFSSTHHQANRSDYLEDREEYLKTVILSGIKTA